MAGDHPATDPGAKIEGIRARPACARSRRGCDAWGERLRRPWAGGGVVVGPAIFQPRVAERSLRHPGLPSYGHVPGVDDAVPCFQVINVVITACVIPPLQALASNFACDPVVAGEHRV